MIRRWLRFLRLEPEPLILAGGGFEARVDALLLALEQDEPSIHRLRQIPMDIIADAVSAYLVESGAPMTDAMIQRALRIIASRNALGPRYVQDSALA